MQAFRCWRFYSCLNPEKYYLPLSSHFSTSASFKTMAGRCVSLNCLFLGVYCASLETLFLSKGNCFLSNTGYSIPTNYPKPF